MKVYFIYRIFENLEPQLYALTDSKKLYKEFLAQRKSSMFRGLVKETISKSEYKELVDKYRRYELGERGYTTKSTSSNFLSNVYIVSTAGEEMDTYTKTDNIFLDVSKYTDDISCTFNSKILEALNVLYYFDIMKFALKFSDNCIQNYIDNFVRAVNEDSLSDVIDMDNLGVFLYLFGNTFNTKLT